MAVCTLEKGGGEAFGSLPADLKPIWALLAFDSCFASVNVACIAASSLTDAHDLCLHRHHPSCTSLAGVTDAGCCSGRTAGSPLQA